jgi:hypothetical protein
MRDRPAASDVARVRSRVRAECVAEEDEGEARRRGDELGGGGRCLSVRRRERRLGVQRHVTDAVEHLVARGAGQRLPQLRCHDAPRRGSALPQRQRRLSRRRLRRATERSTQARERGGADVGVR